MVCKNMKEYVIATPDLRNLEIFWNQIRMEHAQFIRGLLDPTECELMEMADYLRIPEQAQKGRD